MGGVPGPYGPAPSYPPNYPPYPTYPAYPPTMPYGAVPYPPAGFWAQVTSRQKAGLVLGIIGLLLGLIAAFGPFWTLNFTASQSGISITISLNIGMLGGSFSGVSLPVPLTYDHTPFLLTGVLILVGLLLGTVSLFVGLRRGVSGSRGAGVALGVGGAALIAGAPIYFMFAAPSALSQLFAGGGVLPAGLGGFWGSQTITSGGVTLLLSWGGGWAWYLAFVAAVFVALGGVLASGYQPRPTLGTTMPAYGAASGVAPAPSPWAPSQPPTAPEPMSPPTPPSPPPANPGAPPDSAANPPE